MFPSYRRTWREKGKNTPRPPCPEGHYSRKGLFRESLFVPLHRNDVVGVFVFDGAWEAVNLVDEALLQWFGCEEFRVVENAGRQVRDERHGFNGGEFHPVVVISCGHVEIAHQLSILEQDVLIRRENEHELTRGREDFLLLQGAKRHSVGLVWSEKHDVDRLRRVGLVLGGCIWEQEHAGADLSAEAYDAEARREYGEKAFHGYLRIKSKKNVH